MPYRALITRILKHKDIQIPNDLKKKLVNLRMGKEALHKMNLRPTAEGWINLKNEMVKIGDGDGDDEKTKETIKEKMKEPLDTGKKRKQLLTLPTLR